MVVALWLSALAAPVECELESAVGLLEEARIDERRAPYTHPELIPGLAQARGEAALILAIAETCAPGAELSLAVTDRFETAAWSAHTVLLTRNESRGCALIQNTIAISVGVSDELEPTYALRSRLPETQTPGVECKQAVHWRDEEVIAGSQGPVRLVLSSVRGEAGIESSEIVVRRADERGWTETRLISPAPAHLLGKTGGPRLSLAEHDGDPWVVATEACGDPGQTVWIPSNGGWQSHSGREALALLARAGWWRLAGQDAWFLILTQDDDTDRHLLEARMKRLQRKHDGPLSIWNSAAFPGFNPGFLVVAPDPWTDEAPAKAASRSWGPRTRAYVKQAWTAAPCERVQP